MKLRSHNPGQVAVVVSFDEREDLMSALADLEDSGTSLPEALQKLHDILRNI